MTRSAAANIGAMALGALLAIGGCAPREAPSRFYVLTPVAAGAPMVDRPASGAAATAPAPADARPPTVGVGPVRLPGYLDRPQIVTRKSPDQVDLGEFDRWAEPLADAIPRTVAENLAALLPNERVALFPWAGPRSIAYQVLVDVARFDGAPGGDVVLEGSWRILGPDRKDLAERRFAITEACGGPGYPPLVAAMSRALGALSRDIAAALPAR